MNLSTRDGGLPPDNVVQDEDAILADSARLIDRYHQPGAHAMVQIALAPCSPFSVTTSLMRAPPNCRQRWRAPAHPSRRDPGRSRVLRGDVRLQPARLPGAMRLAATSGPGSPTAFISTHDEIARLAGAGTRVTHCPCSNQILASGHCRVCEMEEAGLAVGLGVDGSASNNASNLMQEVRAAFLLQRARYGVTSVAPAMRCAGRQRGRRPASAAPNSG